VAAIQLWQFRRSPYNEKARWALDLAGAPYRRRTLLPGPHPLGLLWTLQMQTPVLERDDGGPLVGSGAIVRATAPALVPGDPALEREASRVEQRFDDELTPRMRRAVLAALLADRDAWVETFAGDESAATQARYRGSLGMIGRAVRWANGIRDDASIEDGARAIEEALELVARGAERTGHLVGDALTLADVAAASSLGSVLDPDHPDTRYGPRGRAAIDALRAKWERHEGTAWVHAIYAAHRAPPRAI
jgi:glutathione S-transferase